MNALDAATALDYLYLDLPRLDCQGKCAESCGPIAMSRLEWARIIERVGSEPVATSLTCPLLADERCTVYDLRPTICRLWGIVESMPCEWGCVPSRPLSDIEGVGFLERAEKLS
jgi:hypothetical protein